MNMRRWNGWLLAILGITITLALGCEKGALGVKGSLVTGRLVDADSPAVPVVGARVTIYSQQPPTGLAELAVGQFFTTVTNAEGRFVFEGVGPDKMILEATAMGYEDFRYPSASAPIQNFYVENNSHQDLGVLQMRKIANPLNRTTIMVKGQILDGKSKDELPATATLSIYFDGQKFQDRDITYAEFKAGLTIPAKNGDYELTILTPNYAPYKNTDDPANPVNGRVDNVLNIVLTPITYDVRVLFTNKPYYINNRVVELGTNGQFNTGNKDKCQVMILSKYLVNGEKKVLASATAVDLDPYEPQVVLSGISLPAEVRVFLSGYKVITTDIPFLPNTQGVIKVEMNMMSTLFTNAIIRRPAAFSMMVDANANASPPLTLRIDDRVQVRVRGMPGTDPVTQQAVVTDVEWGPAPLWTMDAIDDPMGGDETPEYRSLPCGYILPFEITAWLATTNVVNTNTNFFFVEPVREGEAVATFTANLLLSNKALVLPRN